MDMLEEMFLPPTEYLLTSFYLYIYFVFFIKTCTLHYSSYVHSDNSKIGIRTTQTFSGTDPII